MIKVQNLCKSFGPIAAVNGLSFSVERGEILGFLGPNGAGKSTTMRMITGFIPPSSGSVTIGGEDMAEKPIICKRMIGYLPENAPAYTDMTVSEFLQFAAELRGMRGNRTQQAVDRVVEMCSLKTVLHQSIETLSKGFRHRTCFAQAIIHDPDILIMDEPTDGLDPNQKHEIRALIRRMGEEKAIIFSTHILEEVEAVCSRAIIIDRGRIVANGTPQELKNRSETAGAITVRLTGVSTAVANTKLTQLPLVAKTTILEAPAPVASVRVFPKPNGKEGELGLGIYELATREQWKIEELRCEEGRLDDVFRSITLSETATEKSS
ncbi:MAG: ATP-binding cassette domain-containing protein [Verrucomicrobia bacterium]|nr:ATP-binding cassette domain-containing protein [Verrucomicrobiota bacterium]